MTPAALPAAVLSIHDALATELLGLLDVDVARVRGAVDR
jgi:hypothetical protein